MAARYPGAAGCGGVLRIAAGTSLRSLDPAGTMIGEEYIHGNLVSSGLTRMEEDLKVVPDLAGSWNFDEALKNWIFRLRRGVKLHHGREMKAQDVIATCRRILGPAAPAARCGIRLLRQRLALSNRRFAAAAARQALAGSAAASDRIRVTG